MIRSLAILCLLSFSLSCFARIAVTNQPFDFMIVGKGYFATTDSDGNFHYTEDGSFLINKDGFIIDKYGRKLYPELQLPRQTTSIDVDNLGKINIYLNKINKPIYRGQLVLFVKDSTGNFMETTCGEAPYNLEVRQGRQYIAD